MEGDSSMEGVMYMLIVFGIAVVVAVVLIVAMAMPPSRHEHAQNVLGIIPRTVLAWRGRSGEGPAVSGAADAAQLAARVDP
jgi:cbb3-type cytochrome oxidase cytochrome c subunit